MPFQVGDQVRYKPGGGTYGYEDSTEADGRVPGTVIGFTRTRVKVRLMVMFAERRSPVDRLVEAKSLDKQEPPR
jgi:hypothetical protein